MLGQYNDQPTIDKEIVAAAEFRVDFFQILWYSVDDARNRITSEGRQMQPHVEKVNEGLQLFLKSSEIRGMRFTGECVDHAPFFTTPTGRFYSLYISCAGCIGICDASREKPRVISVIPRQQ